MADANHTEIDPYEVLRASHPRLQSVNQRTMWMHMAYATAMLRQFEVQREDAIIDDPYADALSKGCGEAIAKVFPGLVAAPEARTYVALRQYAMDEAMKHRDPRIHQVVLLSAGTNTHAFRLEELRDCVVFEVQPSPDVMAFKEEVMEALGAPVKARKRVVLQSELTDGTWESKLLEAGLNPKEPVFWMADSTFNHLSVDAAIRILEGIHRLSVPHSQLVTERMSGLMELDVDEGDQVTLVIHGETGNGEDGTVYAGFPWEVELLMRRNQVCEYYGTMWDPVRFDRFRLTPEQTGTGAWFFPLFTKPE